MSIVALRALGIFLALLSALIVWLLLHGRLAGLWARLVWLMRNRYCLILALAPPIFAVLGLYGPARSLLHGILILRDSPVAFFNLYAFDLFNITCLSLATVGVGFSQMRIIALHGNARLGSAESLLDSTPGNKLLNNEDKGSTTSDQPALSGANVSEQVMDPLEAGWSLYRILCWLILGLVLPVICAAVCNQEKIPARFPTSTSIGAISAAIVASCAMILILSLMSRWLLGLTGCGVLPFEPTWGKQGPPGWLKSTSDWFFARPRTGLAWWLDGPGYTDEHGRLRPGHAQMFLVAMTSILVFVCWYARSLNSDWQSYTWPACFYVVLLVFTVGMQMAHIAFWIDRFGVPPSVIAIAWMALVYRTGHADHFVDVYKLDEKPQDRPLNQIENEKAFDKRRKAQSAHPTAAMQAASAPIAVDSDADQSMLARVLKRTSADDPHETAEPIQFAKVFEKWKFPQGPDGKRTLVVVTASGGGIQAAAWAAQALVGLDELYEGFSESVGLISSVSGGSVGSLFYIAHRGPRRNSDELPSMKFSDAQRDLIVRCSNESSLEAVSWGVAFPDFVRSVFPALAPHAQDRGWALESAWWNRMGRGWQDRSLMQEIRIRDLCQPIVEGTMPAVVFNATTVETGQRVLISPVRMLQQKDESAATKYNEVAQPIDFIDFYRAPGLEPNPRLSTAVRLSASFSYVSPVARPFPESESKLKTALLAQPPLPKESPAKRNERIRNTAARTRLHFCDGGYADNSGVVTAVRAVQELLSYFDLPHKKAPFDRVLIVRIEPFPVDQLKVAQNNTGFSSALFGPSTALQATRVSTQAERGGLEVALLREARREQEAARKSQYQIKFLMAERNAEAVREWVKEQAKFASPDLANLMDDRRLKIATAVSPVIPSSKNNKGFPSDRLENDNVWEKIEKFQQQLERDDPKISKALEADLTLLKTEVGNAKENKQKSEENPISVESVTFRFQRVGDAPTADDRPPLSWSLSPIEKKRIYDVWEETKTSKIREESDSLGPVEISRFFKPRAKP